MLVAATMFFPRFVGDVRTIRSAYLRRAPSALTQSLRQQIP
jgi:hypothetical protein